MKKRILKTLLCLVIIFSYFFLNSHTFATNEEISQDGIMKEQKDSLGISQFINDSKEYTKGVYDDVDLNEMFNSALTGKIDNMTIIKKILSLLSKEFLGALTTLRINYCNNYYT